jgi:hypothetical protein
MADDALHALLRYAAGEQFRFTFGDGEELLAEVVSATHVDANDTVAVLRVGAVVGECGWQVRLTDIRVIAAPDGRCLFRLPSPGAE